MYRASKQFFQKASLGLNLCQMDGKWIDSNPAFLAMIGYTYEESQHLTYWQLTPAKYHPFENTLIKQLEVEGRYGPYTKEFIRKDGTLIPVRLNGFIIEENGEKLIWSIIEDLTDVTQLEKSLNEKVHELEEKNLFLDAILENIPSAVFLKDATDNFSVTHWNKSAEELFEIPRQKIIGKSAHDLWPKDQADLYLAADKKVSAEGKKVVIDEEPSVSPSRGMIYFKTIKVPLTLKNGAKTKYLLCCSEDITDSRIARIRLERSRQELALITNNLPGTVAIVNREGRYAYVNGVYEKWFGRSPSFYLGRTHEETLPSEVYQNAKAHIQSALNGRKETFAAEVKTPSGEILSSIMTMVPRFDELGVPDGFFSYGHDITAVRDAQARLVEAEKLSSLGELAAGISHEVNNPLAVIQGTVEMLPRFIEDPVKLEAKVALIKKSCERIGKIITGLKNFSRKSDKTELRAVSMKELLNEVITLTSAKAHKFKTEVDLQLEGDLSIYCDQVELEQVLINLINNAIDAVHTLDDKWVKVSAHKEGAKVIVSIIDSGQGIPQHIQDKMFEPFYTTKPIGVGTGLGLSISKNILGKYDATLEIRNDLKNTCFEIKFPAAAA